MRTATKITVKATEEVQKLADTAMAIQDAVNPRAIVGQLKTTMAHFNSHGGNGQEMTGSDMALQNPVSLAILNKLNDLAGINQERTECFTACYDLSEGKDVEWEINTLS